MPSIGKKRLFNSPLAKIQNIQYVLGVLSNCRLQMISQNQFECCLLRHVSMPMGRFGLTELPTFNNISVPIIFPLLHLLVQNSIVLSPTPWMQPAYIPFDSQCSSSLDGKPSASSRRKTAICTSLSLWLSWGAITIPSRNSSQFKSWDPSIVEYHISHHQVTGKFRSLCQQQQQLASRI
jgi:hypothetical protein